MANEIKIRSNMKLANGFDKYGGDNTEYSVTQATARPAVLVGQSSVNVSTAAAITLPGVDAANYGYAQFRNISTTAANYITIGPQSDGATIEPCFRVYGGGPPVTIRLVESVTYWAVSSSGTQVLQMVVFAA